MEALHGTRGPCVPLRPVGPSRTRAHLLGNFALFVSLLLGVAHLLHGPVKVPGPMGVRFGRACHTKRSARRRQRGSRAVADALLLTVSQAAQHGRRGADAASVCRPTSSGDRLSKRHSPAGSAPRWQAAAGAPPPLFDTCGTAPRPVCDTCQSSAREGMQGKMSRGAGSRGRTRRLALSSGALSSGALSSDALPRRRAGRRGSSRACPGRTRGAEDG